ncbi:hypothetical protein [Glycomyces salinus]|uniref:hypothetical protein n=1 Tax=Glycomyces salinus TaxID=980294 RepID=UPI0018EDD5CC|nr:hypothetical protein [Glycomyces salinus]
MSKERLHRFHITALARGEGERAAQFREQFDKSDATTARLYLQAASIVALAHRFGDIERTGLDWDGLDRLMAEIRSGYRHAEPPMDFFAVEAYIRAVYGEEHLMELLDGGQQTACANLLLTWQVRHEPEFKTNLDEAITKAQNIIATWLYN